MLRAIERKGRRLIDGHRDSLSGGIWRVAAMDGNSFNFHGVHRFKRKQRNSPLAGLSNTQ